MRTLVLLIIGSLAAPALAAPPKVDWLFPAGVQRGQSVTITIGGRLERWPAKVWTSSEQLRAVAEKSKGKIQLTAGDKIQPGLYWMRLYDEQGSSSPRPIVVGTLPEVTEAEPNNDRTKPQRLESSRLIVNGRLEKAGDVDTYAVTLKKGQTVVASMEANRTLGSPMDAILQVVSAGGFVLEQNDDDHGLDPQIAFTAPADGDYLVRTFAFPATPNSTIGFAGGATFVYRLTVTTGGFVDFALPLAVSKGGQKPLRLVGWNLPKSSVEFPAGKVDADVFRIADPQFANTLTLPTVTHPTVVEQTPLDDPGPQDVVLPATVTGQVERPRDTDTFRFMAKKGQRLRFRAESRSLGYPLDPHLLLRDAKGKTLAQNDDEGPKRDALLNYTIRADGTYELVIRDVHRHGGPRYVYRLTAAEVTPDFALSVTADSFVVAKGKPLTIAVKVARLDGFAGRIEVRAVDLPQGVTCEPVVSPPKGKTAAAVNLSVKPTGKAISGPIRIVGKALDASKLQRAATAPVLSGAAHVSSLWLTVSP